MRRIAIIPLLLLFLLSGAACRQSTSTVSTLVMTMEVASGAPAVGRSEIIVTIHDESGSPVNDATVELRGDMTHAGMQPVLATAEPSGDGTYRAPFEWTMGGDWILTATATLPDGRKAAQEFPLTVGN